MNSLDSGEWLSDKAIDEYLLLIQDEFKDICFIFPTLFWTTFLNGGYGSIENLIENVNMSNRRYLLFAFNEKNHWFLGIF